VSDDLCNKFWQNTYLRHFILTWVQNGPVEFEKDHTTRKKTIYVPNDGYVVSVGLQWTNSKIGKIVTLCQREMFKKIPGLGTVCTQSVNEGLTSLVTARGPASFHCLHNVPMYIPKVLC
jgi:hypothetical protein